MNHILPFIFLGLLWLTACAGPAAAPPPTETGRSPEMTVYRSPT